MASTRERDERVDELRHRLRALGYLDAGVDRFVLAPARQTRHPAVIALLASLRIGALAAVLLGPAAVVGLSERLPGLVTGTRDAVVLTVYMGLLFGLAVAAAAFASSLMVVWLARHAGSLAARGGSALSLAAGIMVGLLCLVYLTLWWQTANAGFGWQAPAWTAFALAVAVAISLLLGHAVTLTALALTMTGHDEADASGVPGSSWPVLVTAGVIAFSGAAVLLVLTASAESRDDEAPALTVMPSGLRIRLLAIDGFDPRIFDELSAAGRVPALAAAAAQARARLAPDVEGGAADPARTWTTIATGQPSSVHGVQGLETRRVPGVQGSLRVPEETPLQRAVRGATDLLRLTRPALTSGTERRASTVWEVAAQAGLRTTVVNWWATWPAPENAGVILTDRATLRLETGGELDAEIAPSSEYERLRRSWPDIRSHATTRASDALSEAKADSGIRALLERSARLDALQLLLAAETTARSTDLLAVYLPGLDIAQHALLGSGERPMLAASTLAARLDGVREYYAVLERLLRPELVPETDEVVLLVTSSGRTVASAGGLLVARGAATATSSVLDGKATDVAPTVLYLLGLPVSRELAGTPLTALFAQSFTAHYPVRYVTRYSRPSLRPLKRAGQPLDQEMIDRLRSLGYVK